MKLQSKHFVLFLLLVALLPFCVVCFYALPFADDFCFGWTASENISFTEKVLNQYLWWNGRYTADVLVNLHPLITGKIIFYQLSLFVSLIATPFVLFFLLREFIAEFSLSVILSLFITLFSLNYQPNVTEGIYWFIGIANYHLGNLCLLLHFIFLLKLFSAEEKRKIFYRILCFAFLIVSIGFNEVGAMLIPIFYFTFLVFNFKSQTLKVKLLATLFILSILASAFVFFSPGNFIRGNEFPERYNLLYSVFYASAQTFRFLVKWIFNVPFLLSSIVILANADSIKTKLPLPDVKLLSVALLLLVFTGSFLPYFATGTLGQHRTLNYVFFYFHLLWVLFVVSASQKFLLYKKLDWLKDESRIFTTLLICILLLLITGNSMKIVSDCKTDSFRKYESAFFERQKAILKNPHKPIQPLFVVPKIFEIVDIKGDTSWWVDKCMKRYYTETKIELK